MEALFEKFRSFSVKKKPSLPLNLLPYSLKTAVFEYSSPTVLLKFLKINEELRHFVLRNGPFQKRLSKLIIQAYESRYLDGQLLVGQLELILVADESRISFEVTNERGGSLADDGWHVSIIPTDSPLFRNLTFCEQLSLSLQEQPTPRELEIPINSFIPRFGGHLKAFELNIDDWAQAMRIFEQFPARIVKSFNFDASNRWETVPEGPGFKKFFEENLNECEEIVLYRARLEVSPLFTDPTLPRPKTRRIDVLSINNDFIEASKSILRNGIPSQDPLAEIKISTTRYHQVWTLLDSFGKRLCEDLDRLAEQVDEPLVCREIVPKFSDPSSLDELLAKGGLVEAKFYKQRFSEHLYYYYIFMRFRVEIQLFVKSEPIFDE